MSTKKNLEQRHRSKMDMSLLSQTTKIWKTTYTMRKVGNDVEHV